MSHFFKFFYYTIASINIIMYTPSFSKAFYNMINFNIDIIFNKILIADIVFNNRVIFDVIF